MYISTMYIQESVRCTHFPISFFFLSGWIPFLNPRLAAFSFFLSWMPVVVRDSSLGGKGLFATERFSSGDVIIAETPLAVSTSGGGGGDPLYTPVWVLLDALARNGHLASLDPLQPMAASALSWEEKDDVASMHVAAAHGLHRCYVDRMYAVVASINIQCPHGCMAVYPMLSYLNHACRPNCHIHYAGTTVELCAVKDVAMGEELTISFVSPSVDAPQCSNAEIAKLIVNQMFGFDCRCAAHDSA